MASRISSVVTGEGGGTGENKSSIPVSSLSGSKAAVGVATASPSVVSSSSVAPSKAGIVSVIGGSTGHTAKDFAMNDNNTSVAAIPITPKITTSFITIENRWNSTCDNNNSNAYLEGDTESEISSISDFYCYSAPSTQQHPHQNYHYALPPTPPPPPPPRLVVQEWDKKKLYSDFVRDGIIASRIRTGVKNVSNSGNNNGKVENVVMLFESPSCSTHETSFFNGQTFKFYDYPPAPAVFKSILAPCRYTMMNGNVYPSYLSDGITPPGLIEHWKDVIPNFVTPTIISSADFDAKQSLVYAYLPVEHIPHHVKNPHVHYHVSGKDVLHLMTRRTPKLLTNTRDRRPCICKATHAMGNKGTFIIRNDDDERRLERTLSETGNPTFVVTEYIDAVRSLSSHFFIHPNSNKITWIGSNENLIRNVAFTQHDTRIAVDSEGSATNVGGFASNKLFNHDTIIVMKDQERLKQLQLPFVEDVVKYFQARDFWGFCGIDVLFDKNGDGYLVDVNPRVTGSSPAIMVALRLNELSAGGYEFCVFRRGCRSAYHGTSEQLMSDVRDFNEKHSNDLLILITGFVEIDNNSVLHQTSTTSPSTTLIQLAVYGKNSLEDCVTALNNFAQHISKPSKRR